MNKEGDEFTKGVSAHSLHAGSCQLVHPFIQDNSNKFVQEEAVISLDPVFHSAVKFFENHNPNTRSTNLDSNAGSSSLKRGRLKLFKNKAIILRGKGSKFKVKAWRRVSVMKAIAKKSERIGTEDLNAEENILHEESVDTNNLPTSDV